MHQQVPMQNAQFRYPTYTTLVKHRYKDLFYVLQGCAKLLVLPQILTLTTYATLLSYIPINICQQINQQKRQCMYICMYVLQNQDLKIPHYKTRAISQVVINQKKVRCHIYRVRIPKICMFQIHHSIQNRIPRKHTPHIFTFLSLHACMHRKKAFTCMHRMFDKHHTYILLLMINTPAQCKGNLHAADAKIQIYIITTLEIIPLFYSSQNKLANLNVNFIYLFTYLFIVI
eukprot:TRINITY_DN13136_c1_g1_i11.p1 TRINITY_DN13136_c1_g1~~TRINITY_DN13136_c1_g1_i11.p1  ORF type:complete len:230 (+),score=-20.79 TRINITY_DN13136_c1_g1_i11:62-751(+)